MIVPKATKTGILTAEVEESIADLLLLVSKVQPGLNSNNHLFVDYISFLTRILEQTNVKLYIGLEELMLIMIEGIELLQKSGRPISEHESEFINNFPQLLSDYLELPESKIPATILVKHFNDPEWIRSLTKDEQVKFMGFIHSHNIVRDEIASGGNEILEKIIKDNDDNGSSAKVHGFEKDYMLSADSDNIQPEQSEELSLDDFIGLSSDNVDVDADVDADVYDVVDLLETNKESVEENHSEVDCLYNIENNLQVNHIDAHHQELIDLVCGELLEIIESLKDVDNISGKLLYQTLVVMSEQLENIGNAVQLIGLTGLTKVSEIISKNINIITDKIDIFNEDIRYLIKIWPGCYYDYLTNLYDIEKTKNIVSLIHNDNWPTKLSSQEIESIEVGLANPSLVEEEVVERQTVATLEDVSIALPEDVNHDLLEGLLQDLPAQTEEFSEAVQRLKAGGVLEDIDVAQRIAHTLKGAANVVGVKGIANLTHHLEDILEVQSKAKKIPIKPLADLLVSAADCLEAMSDALLGVDEAPADSVIVMQKVLDWANKLDIEGVQDNQEEYTTTNSGSQVNLSLVESVPAVKKEKELISAENMLRIPVRLADDLLRLAGENLISTGQIQDRIKNILFRQEALQIHNQSLQKISFDLEHLIDIQGISTNVDVSVENGDFDSLEMDKYNELHSVSRRLVEVAADSASMAQVLDDQLTELQNLVISQRQVQKENQEIVLRTRMVSVKNIVPRLKRGVRQACRLTNKNVDLKVEDNDTYMDSEVLNNLIEPLMHILRNAVDHGIESSQESHSKDKNEYGIINIRFERLGDQVAINIEDNGRGMNLSSIRDTAIMKGLIKPESELSDDAIRRLILEPGFTTRKDVTQISGRGIGLDVVSVAIRELKGTINIFSEENKGSRFELILPVSSFSTHSLLVKVRKQTYALSNRGIEEILYPGLGELCELGDEVVFQVGDEVYTAIDFDNLLNFPIDRRSISRATKPVVIVKNDSGEKTAILVQEVLDSSDVVVKPMGQYVPKLNGIIGATILGDGSVSPVIDLPELLENKKSCQNEFVYQGDKENYAAKRSIPYVLVVDDSLSARRSLSQFVQDMGLDVRTARDGMEAVSLIDARKPDLLLVDMEMPKMNGLELTSHIRSSEHIGKMPIIMITSRSTDKHRKTAFDKGVNHFMVKPYAEDELAEQINTALKIAS